MNIWIDAQLSPSLAAWINRTFPALTAQSVTALGLRDASDMDIFREAAVRQVIIMTKDDDFLKMVNQYGPPPYIILITCGNTSNARMREILSQYLLPVINLIKGGEALIEIKGE